MNIGMVNDFLKQAAGVMHPQRPVDVTLDDCLEAIRELYPTRDALEEAEHTERMLRAEVEGLERDLQAAQKNVARLEVELEDLKAKDCPVCADRELDT